MVRVCTGTGCCVTLFLMNKGQSGSIAEVFKSVLLPSSVWTLPQASCWGLMEAVERFDPAKGTKFGTYAVHWIRCKCSEVAAAERDVIYVPYEAAQRRAEVSNAQSALKTALDRLALLAACAFLFPGAKPY